MFITHKGRAILCVSTTKPEGVTFIESPDMDPAILFREYEVINGELVSKVQSRDYHTLKIAMVTSYGINCGLATYAKYVCDEMRPLVGELRIFAEEASDADTSLDAKDNVVRCWKREGDDYKGVFTAMQAYDPDIIYIQHEYGCFGNGARWNTMAGHLSANWRTVIVLHSIYNQFDKLVFEAPCSEIIVHSKSGRELLKSRGVDHCPVHFIPHGCMPMKEVDVKYSKMGKDFVVFQYGFGFEYKGWDNVIEIIDRLKSKFDVVYIGVFNISKFSESFGNSYYRKLMEKIKDRGLQDNIVLHKGFRSENVLLSYMAQAKVNLFPYWNHPDWRVHGASGAIRLALASGTPLCAGAVPFFDELVGYVPVCATIEQYVEEITKIFTDPEYAKSVRDGAATFIQERTWDKIAKWYLACLPGAEFSAPVGRE